LTAERLQPRYVKGFQVLEWHCPSGARNEPLDLEVYCLAMLELVKRRYNRATMWDQLERLADAQAPQPQRPLQRRPSQYW
jgi:phage terminase large subunit GpA-like protein